VPPTGPPPPLIGALLPRPPPCRSLHVSVQKEVAERILAAPNTRDFGALGVICQALAEGEVIAEAPGSCFWPPPRVTSAMISLRRRPKPLTSDPAALETLTRTLFTKRRKQLGAILGRDRVEAAGVDPARRPESLSVPEIAELARLLGRPECPPHEADGSSPGR